MPFDPSSAVLDEPKSSTGFDPSGGVELVEDQPTPSARAYVPAPGEMVPTVSRQPSLMPQMAPVAEMQAEQAKSIPPLAEGEAEAMLMTPQMHIPRSAPEGSGWRGAEDLVYGPPEFLTAPGAPLILTAQLIPVVREVVDTVLGASMVKAGAQELGEASVTGNKEKLVRGTGSLLLGTAGVSVPWLRETVANELAARKVGNVDPALIDSIVKERLSIRDKAAQVVEPGTHEKLMPRATETFEATTGTKAAESEVTNASKVGEGETVLRDVLRDAQEGKGTEALPINEGQPGVRTQKTEITPEEWAELTKPTSHAL